MGRHRSIDLTRAIALGVVFAAGSTAQAAVAAGDWVGVVLAVLLAGFGIVLVPRYEPAPAGMTSHVHHHVNVFPRAETDPAVLAAEIRAHLDELALEQRHAEAGEVQHG